MTFDHFIHSLQGLFSLGILFTLLFPIRFFVCVGVLRDDMFELRRDLFRRATEGFIRFDSPAYIALNDVLNNLIRFAHFMSPGALLLIERPRAGRITAESKAWYDAISSVQDESQRRYLLDIRLRIVKRVFWHLCCQSPIGSVLLAFRLGLIEIRRAQSPGFTSKPMRRALLAVEETLFVQVEASAAIHSAQEQDSPDVAMV